MHSGDVVPIFVTLELSGTLTLTAITAGSVLFAGTNGLISEDNTNFSFNNTTNILSVAGLTLSGLTASRLISTNGSKALTSVTDLGDWFTGSDGISVSDAGSGRLDISGSDLVPYTGASAEVRLGAQGLSTDNFVKGAQSAAGFGFGDATDILFSAPPNVSFRPATDNNNYNGEANYRWKGIYGVDITASGTMAGGTVTGANVTSGADPGHTHTGASLSGIDISDDTNLVAGINLTLVGDTLNVDDPFSVASLTVQNDANTKFVTSGTTTFTLEAGASIKFPVMTPTAFLGGFMAFEGLGVIDFQMFLKDVDDTYGGTLYLVAANAVGGEYPHGYFQYVNSRVQFSSSTSCTSLYIDDDAVVTGTLDVTGATTLSSTLAVTGVSTFNDDLYVKDKEVRFYDNGNYVSFKAPALDDDYLYAWPVDYGTDGYLLKTDGAGVLSWAHVIPPAKAYISTPIWPNEAALWAPIGHTSMLWGAGGARTALRIPDYISASEDIKISMTLISAITHANLKFDLSVEALATDDTEEMDTWNILNSVEVAFGAVTQDQLITYEYTLSSGDFTNEDLVVIRIVNAGTAGPPFPDYICWVDAVWEMDYLAV